MASKCQTGNWHFSLKVSVCQRTLINGGQSNLLHSLVKLNFLRRDRLLSKLFGFFRVGPLGSRTTRNDWNFITMSLIGIALYTLGYKLLLLCGIITICQCFLWLFFLLLFFGSSCFVRVFFLLLFLVVVAGISYTSL